jgi:hypothetical protein
MLALTLAVLSAKAVGAKGDMSDSMNYFLKKARMNRTSG